MAVHGNSVRHTQPGKARKHAYSANFGQGVYRYAAEAFVQARQILPEGRAGLLAEATSTAPGQAALVQLSPSSPLSTQVRRQQQHQCMRLHQSWTQQLQETAIRPLLTARLMLCRCTALDTSASIACSECAGMWELRPFQGCTVQDRPGQNLGSHGMLFTMQVLAAGLVGYEQREAALAHLAAMGLCTDHEVISLTRLDPTPVYDAAAAHPKDVAGQLDTALARRHAPDHASSVGVARLCC